MTSSHHPLPDLPHDLITDILLRLPVKSLVRFKSVCKQWKSMLISPSFVKKHFYHEHNHTHLLVCWFGILPNHKRLPYRSPCGLGAIKLYSGETLESQEEPNHLKLPGQVHALRGPCNGIYCLQCNNATFFLWNPATRKLWKLPPLPPKFRWVSDFGFGTDTLTNEFKIVAIHCGYKDHNPRRTPKCFYVYSSNNDSWKYIKQKSIPISVACILPITGRCWRTTFVNGCYYWRKWYMGSDSSVILEFDMHGEVFHEIEMPESIRGGKEGQLVVHNSDLALFSFDERDDKKYLEIWVMSKGEEGCSWKKLSTVAFPFDFRLPLSFWKKNKIVVSTRENKMMLYDQESGDITNLQVEKLDSATLQVWPSHYKESLVIPVKNREGIPHYDIQSATYHEFFNRTNWLEIDDYLRGLWCIHDFFSLWRYS